MDAATRQPPCEFCTRTVADGEPCRGCGATTQERTRVRRERWEPQVKTDASVVDRGETLWTAWVGTHHAVVHPTREGAIEALWQKCEEYRGNADFTRAIDDAIRELSEVERQSRQPIIPVPIVHGTFQLLHEDGSPAGSEGGTVEKRNRPLFKWEVTNEEMNASATRLAEDIARKADEAVAAAAVEREREAIEALLYAKKNLSDAEIKDARAALARATTRDTPGASGHAKRNQDR